MAEALALIGLVSNILGFIEFGVTLVSVTQSLGDARKVPDISELDSILDDIQLRHDGLRQHLESSNLKLSKADSNLLTMVQQCDKITERLRDLSKKLEGRSRFGGTIRFVIKKKEIDELRERLMRLDGMVKWYIRTAFQR